MATASPLGPAAKSVAWVRTPRTGHRTTRSGAPQPGHDFRTRTQLRAQPVEPARDRAIVQGQDRARSGDDQTERWFPVDLLQCGG